MRAVAVTEIELRQTLDDYVDPLIGQGLDACGAIADIQLADGQVRITLELGFPAAGHAESLRTAVQTLIREAHGLEAQVEVRWQIQAQAVQGQLQPLPEIRNIIAVASGKGGVGKSTVAANLALALHAEGAKVGLLDADIYGPSQPRMMGVSKAKPETPDGKLMHPVMAHGLQVSSIGFLVDEESPTIWRGPMVTQALTQLINGTAWKDLDYLIIDLPPGTGDVQLSLAQRIPVSGAVIVTTPQDIALLDARKGLRMFQRVEVPVLGVVENMSFHVCSSCGHHDPVFGSGGGERLADEHEIELLGQLPLDIRIREQADGGAPTVVAEPDSDNAQRYREIARKAAARLAYSQADDFPEIVISDD